jgi:hypothetical protein
MVHAYIEQTCNPDGVSHDECASRVQTQVSVETSATVEMIRQMFRDIGTWQTWNAGMESLEIEGPFASGTLF